MTVRAPLMVWNALAAPVERPSFKLLPAEFTSNCTLPTSFHRPGGLTIVQMFASFLRVNVCEGHNILLFGNVRPVMAMVLPRPVSVFTTTKLHVAGNVEATGMLRV